MNTIKIGIVAFAVCDKENHALGTCRFLNKFEKIKDSLVVVR